MVAREHLSPNCEKLFWIRPDKIATLLQGISNMILQNDPSEAMKKLIEKTAEILSIQRSCLFLVNEDSEDELVLAYGYPENAHSIGIKIKIGEHPLLKRAMEDESIFVETRPKEIGCISGISKERNINAVLYVRLDDLGVMVLDATDDKKDFSQEEMWIAKQISDLVVSNIENVKRTRQRTEELTIGMAHLNVTHEIRNPLTAAGGFLERSLKELKSPDGQPNENADIAKVMKYMEIVRKELRRIEKLVANTTDFVNPQELDKKETDLNALIESVVAENGNAARINNSLGKIRTLLLDEKQIKKLLRELVSNALEELGNTEDRKSVV